MQEYRDAILAAHTAGHSLREIAQAVGTSHVAVLQVVKRGSTHGRT